MITEDYVSFETAKLLKEKGFDDVCRAFWKDWYNEKTLCECSPLHCFNYCTNIMLAEKYSNENEINIAAPTLQKAMKWLRERYNLDIFLYHSNLNEKHNSKWWFEIIKYPNTVAEHEAGIDEEVDTYEEAAEAAVKYCLEHLI